jgi:hypothetical protein
VARKSKDDEKKAGKRKPWQFMSKFVIQDENGDPMLVRWRIIQTPYGALYLHKFLRGDSDPFVHDHPWSFLSIILKGGYTEARRHNKTYLLYKHHVTRFNLMHRYDAHYIMELDRTPTWSLLLVGPRKRTWGFYVEERPSDSLIGSFESAVHPDKRHAAAGYSSGVPNQRWIEFDNWEKEGGRKT